MPSTIQTNGAPSRLMGHLHMAVYAKNMRAAILAGVPGGGVVVHLLAGSYTGTTWSYRLEQATHAIGDLTGVTKDLLQSKA